MARGGKFGPGFLVAAAFIGPGTVTTATLAGANHGYSLIWVVVAATLVAMVLQEMAGRFSLATQSNVAEALVRLTPKPWLKVFLQILAFLAIILGCAAYEAGNIIGGSLGLELLGGGNKLIWIVIISISAIALLWKRNYKLIEGVLIGLVVVMGISFFVAAIIVKPHWGKIIAGLLPQVPGNSFLLIMGLLGTTVVPYNIFLHSASILKKWRGAEDIPVMRTDAYLSIGLGGVITAAIVITAAASYFLQGVFIAGPADLSRQLAPLYGRWAQIFLGIGLFSAGFSSAITAPYAAAWTARGLFGWKEESWQFRTVFLAVILFGAVVSVLALKPLHMIVVAQVTNALLLPIVALFLIYLLNKREAGVYRNTWFQNLLFVIVFVVILLINFMKFI